MERRFSSVAEAIKVAAEREKALDNLDPIKRAQKTEALQVRVDALQAFSPIQQTFM